MKRVLQIVLIVMFIVILNVSSVEAWDWKELLNRDCDSTSFSCKETGGTAPGKTEAELDEYVIPGIRMDEIWALVHPWLANLERDSGRLDSGYCSFTNGFGWDGGLRWPVDGGKVRPGRYFKETRNHRGIDIEAPPGTAVLAAENGPVVWAGYTGFGWGNTVITSHGGYTIVYAHLGSVNVECGDYVSTGTNIGTVGAIGSGLSTFSHVHFEVRYGDSVTEATAVSIDPRRFLRGG